MAAFADCFPMPDPLLVDVPSALETGRLLLRTHRAGDGPALYEALAESITELRRFLWFLPWVAAEPSLESAEIRCRQCEANFIARTDLAYLAFDKASGRLVGSVGLHRTDWSVPKTEVGYWIRASAAGMGFISEGVEALVAWALRELGARRVEIVTDEGNLPSRNVAERCGFELEGTLRNVLRSPDGTLHNNCIYARLAAEV
jgi:RimJ/RimL family protein N-acetyltransferase